MSIDKSKYIMHINDENQIIVVRKLLDKIERVLEYHSIEYTDFLDPYQRKLCYSVLNRFIDIKYHEEGGHDDAERKSIIIYKDYVIRENIEKYISVLEIRGNFKFKEVSHRDFLGSILGLGLKREKIGDIYLHNDYSHIIVLKEIEDYILLNFNKIGNTSIDVKPVHISTIKLPQDEGIEKNITVASLRLDAFISSSLNISRTDSMNIVKSNKVRVNYEPILRADKILNEGDLVSIRGKGRIRLKSVLGNTNKGRIRGLIKIYR